MAEVEGSPHYAVRREVLDACCALCGYTWTPKRWPPRRCARKRCSSPNWARGWTYEARRVQALERRKGEERGR